MQTSLWVDGRRRFNMDTIMNLDQRGIVKGERVPATDVHATDAGTGTGTHAGGTPGWVTWVLGRFRTRRR